MEKVVEKVVATLLSDKGERRVLLSHAETMHSPNPHERPAVEPVILSNDTIDKREVIHQSREREAKVDAGVWMWWMDRSRSDNSQMGAAAVYKHRDGWKVFCGHLGTRCGEVYNAEPCAIRLALRKSVKKRDTLQTHRVTMVAVFSDMQETIRQTEHLEPA